MTNPKLALIPSGYKATKVYSILPSDGGGDFTFDRTSEGTRVRKDGLIEEVSNDVPRLDWLNSNCPSLLLEPQRTNLNTFSDPTDAQKSSTSYASVTFQDNFNWGLGSVLENAIVFVDNSTTRYAYYNSTVSSGTEYTLSAFIKMDDNSVPIPATDFLMVLAGVSFVSGYNVESYGNNIYRVSVSGTASASNTANGILKVASHSAKKFNVTGFQLEVGSYATSYIKSNSGSTTTRFKDECINAGDSDLFNITEGTFFVDANNFGAPYLGYNMITLSDGSSNLVRFIYESSRIRTSVENGSSQQDYFIAGVNDNERNKVAITFKENEFKTYLNGVLKDTDLIGVVPTNLDRLNFASQSGTSRHFEGKVYDTRVYDRVLTEAEAIELTTL